MKYLFLIMAAGLLLPLGALEKPVPKADPGAVVRSGEARFTVLTPQLLRLEWSANSQFTDDATLVFLNRRLPVPPFQVRRQGGWLTIRTDRLTLRYREGSGRFRENNLEITLSVSGQKAKWRPGTVDPLNLRGTTRTLDGWNGGNPELLEPGLLSRNGWSLVDDSASLLFDEGDWPWVKKRPAGDRQDWYFFGYGHDYRRCLADFTRIAGKIPLPPKFAFGYWWSRYWTYSDRELRRLVTDMRNFGVPIDVLVIDMDWHLTHGLTWDYPQRDPFGQSIGWTGYTWNRSLFPDPAGFLRWTDLQRLKTALNLHPASGVPPMEEQYEAFAKRLGFDTGKQEYIPFAMENREFAQAYFNLLLKPMEEAGIDFWWIDWQQWLESKTVPGLSNTWWLNYTFFTRLEREGKRPLLFHRWGGLGNHRYQIGFSGDTVVTWDSLAFQPYFTATAANVGYGYWSHDIGGHNPKAETDPELYLRWLQWGTFSPILRTHVTKSRIIERRIWRFPDHFSWMKETLQRRYALAPYIYTMSRKAYDTGVSICRPLYYDHPEQAEAYGFTGQYYFGDHLLVSPVTSPLHETDQLSRNRFWLPAGKWVEWDSGRILDGGRVHHCKYAIDEVPVFARAGAVIPLYPPVDNLQEQPDTLVVALMPGGDGETLLYEDDETTPAYREDACAWTRLHQERLAGGGRKLTVEARQGKYAGMPAARAYEIRFEGIAPPRSVRVDGTSYPFQGDGRPGTWQYDGRKLTAVVRIPSTPCDRDLTVALESTTDVAAILIEGMAGRFNRLSRAVEEMKAAAEARHFLPDWLYALEQTAERISAAPETARTELDAFQTAFASLPRRWSGIDIGDPVTAAIWLAHLSEKVTVE